MLKIPRTVKTIKRRSCKLFYKLFIYFPIDLAVISGNYIKYASANLKNKISGGGKGYKAAGTVSASAPVSPSTQVSASAAMPQEFEKRILLIRHDGIGDYILCRNFIEILKNSVKFKNYKISLLGNAAWKELAEFLDKDFADGFIWVDRKKFTSDFVYRYKKIKEITSGSYEVLIHPFSGDFFNADNDLAFLVKAGEKFGSVKTLPRQRHIKSYKKIILEKIYTGLISDPEGILFEFYKNKNFFEKILGEKIDIKKPFIKLNPAENKELNSKLGLPALYAAFFIGASVKHRKWPVKNFAETARHLKIKYGCETVLCGGRQESEDALKFAQYCGEWNVSFINAVGNISLVDLLYVIKNASLVVSNETMAPHIAMALSVSPDNSEPMPAHSSGAAIAASFCPHQERAAFTFNASDAGGAGTGAYSRSHGVASAQNANAYPHHHAHPAAKAAHPAVLTISAGEDRYGHFSPYPEDISDNYFIVFHPEIANSVEKYIYRAQTAGGGYDDRFDISGITVQTVIDKIDEIWRRL